MNILEDSYAMQYQTLWIVLAACFTIIIAAGYRYLVERKQGRITFIPLDKVFPQAVKVPKGFPSSTVKPLHSVLEYNQRFKKAILQVVGKVVVCEDLPTATRLASKGYNCVTTDGDEVAKRGSIRGGYYDVERSKLKAIKEYKEVSKKLMELNNERNEIGSKMSEKEQALNKLIEQIDALQLQNNKKQASNVSTVIFTSCNAM